MRTHQTNDSKHWRDRAAQIRDIAIKMQGTEAAILMGDLANDYDKFADNNERKPIKENRPK
jgi:protein subunit release factor A